MNMNLPQLNQFAEGLSKMLADGIGIKRALQVASGCMAAPANRRFAESLGRSLLSGEDLPIQEFSRSLPPFFLTIIQCGILTGRLPQALASAAYYIRQVLPVRYTLRRYGWYSLVAYLVCIVITVVFRHRPSLVVLFALIILYVLPRWLKNLAYIRDAILAKMPFVGTWIQQVSLLEFFSCLDICYDSTLSVQEMFDSSIRAVGNLSLRQQLLQSKEAIEHGDSFAEALRRVQFIPRGMITDIRVNESCGKLELSFHGFARELRKLIEAKLQPIKALTAGFVISYGVIIPLLVILPVFLDIDWLPLYLMVMIGELWLICLYMAVVNYLQKAVDVNCWWDGLRDNKGVQL
jgi:type II secretory pathway component PulF